MLHIEAQQHYAESVAPSARWLIDCLEGRACRRRLPCARGTTGEDLGVWMAPRASVDCRVSTTPSWWVTTQDYRVTFAELDIDEPFRSLPAECASSGC